MGTSFQVIDRWIHRASSSLTILIPGLVALLLIDLNVNTFQGEFGFSNFLNFDTLIYYYADKINLTDGNSFLSALIMVIPIYMIGYFLHSSSKFFAGPHRFRSWLKVSDPSDELLIELPKSAQTYLRISEDEMVTSLNEKACMAIISSSALPSLLPGLKRRIDFYRSLGYLFCLMAILDICLFSISFDFENIVAKCSLVVINITFAFLFFKGQEECSLRKKDTLLAETYVAVSRLSP